MADYIPRDEAGRIEWLQHFAAWMTAYGAAHGFTPAEITTLNTDVGDADTAVTDTVDKEAIFRAAVVAKQGAIGDAIHLAREDVHRLQADPTMTDAERAAAGITVPDLTPTPASASAVHEHVPPECAPDWSKRLQITLHFGLNPHDEHRNARPAGTLGAQIQYCRGGIPEHEADWVTLDIDTESPYIHIIHEDTPTTYAYRACWVDKKLNHGPYGDPAVCTVSV
ncbi:MAG TPA: hypothetical protein VMZ06_03820 [Candidatus Bathyarchaeia archaeon]|nr:hypothetical protein [Candidatus Bathyarchaeia archaeon]